VERLNSRRDSTVTPMEDQPMRTIGRFQLRVRTLLFIPVIVAFSWWLAIQMVDRQNFQYLVEEHEAKALSYQKIA
jgi:hypothetical protein